MNDDELTFNVWVRITLDKRGAVTSYMLFDHDYGNVDIEPLGKHEAQEMLVSRIMGEEKFPNGVQASTLPPYIYDRLAILMMRKKSVESIGAWLTSQPVTEGVVAWLHDVPITYDQLRDLEERITWKPRKLYDEI